MRFRKRACLSGALCLGIISALCVPALANRKTPLGGTAPGRLLELVKGHERITVIVGVTLDRPWLPTGLLTAREGRAQDARVRARKNAVLRAYRGAKLLQGLDFAPTPYFAVWVNEATLRALLDSDAVASIEEDSVAESLLVDTTPLIGATVAHDRGLTGDGKIVAIIDSGVQSSHEFLAGRVLTSDARCFSGTGVIAPDGMPDPRVTFCHHPTPLNTEEGPTAAEPCTEYAVGRHDCEHGTHVAGIAAGRAAGNGFSGVAPDAMILPILTLSRRLCPTPDLGPILCPDNNNPVAHEQTDVLRALYYVRDLARDRYPGRIAAVNMSFGLVTSGRLQKPGREECDTEFGSIKDIVAELKYTYRVAVVAAAGNDVHVGQFIQGIQAPACITNVVAVAATTKANPVTHVETIAPYSNNGTIVDLLAPGGTAASQIISSIPYDPGVPSDPMNNPKYGLSFGTSMAAPHVAGAFAVLRQRSPGASVDKLLQDLVHTGLQVTDSRLAGGPFAKPRINVDKALNRAARHDFNRDGYSDILWRNVVTGENMQWWMTGASAASRAVQTVADPNFKIVGIGDFQGDGIADVLWRNSVTGANVMWLMNGTTVAAGVVLTTVGTPWSVAAVGDFQGDGKADIVWRNNLTGDNSIWLMDGPNVAASATLPSVPDTNFKIVGVGDFQGDGNDDLLWRNSSTGANVLWFMSGLYVASSQLVPALSDTDWVVAGVGDFQNDGMADIFWRNTVTGSNAMWLMVGAAVAASGALPSVFDTNWKVARVADFDGDGMSDVLWRNAVTGSNSIWLMNGLQPRITAALPAIADANWQIPLLP